MKPIEGDIYELPKINETNFLRNYLPGLLNNDSPEGRTKWINEVSLQPGIRVEVVDDNDHSKILYWVPPAIYTPTTIMGSNMGQLIENAVVTSVVRHNQRILTDTIKEFEFLMKQPEPPQEDVDQWKLILDRYGLLGKKDEVKGSKNGSDGNVRPTLHEEEDW